MPYRLWTIREGPGLLESAVVLRHALRNALIPVATGIGRYALEGVNFRGGDARNFVNFSDPQYDKLVEEGQTVADERARKRI